MKTALFTNFTDREFTGYWDGKSKTFGPGQAVYMPDYLARHYAKHLVNRELLRVDSSGSPVYKDGEKMTSPKFPEQVPLFMGLFNKAYTPDETESIGDRADDVDTLIQVANKNRQEGGSDLKESEKPQVISSPDLDEDDDAFEDKPKET